MSEKIVRHSLEQPSGSGPFQFSVGSEVAVVGWAFVDSAATPTTLLEVISRQSGAARRIEVQRSRRPDVAKHFGAKSVEMSGFAGTLRIDPRFQGDNRVRLLQIEQPGSEHAVDLFSFTVVPAVYESHVRRDLAARFLQGAGLEIGALQRPLPVPSRCQVSYVDRMPLVDLLRHYPELRGLPIQKPDLIDDGETLGQVADQSQDFVVANHLLEHCENPLKTLMNFSRVLKPGGILYMAVPDKRFTFDIDRPVTPYAVLAETYQQGHRRDREALYSEWTALVNHVPEPELASASRKLLQEGYSIHFNVWALTDLIEFLQRGLTEFGVPFDLEWLVSSENEVITILRKKRADVVVS
jgi:SAM-dependent methyltransferase